MTHQKVKNHEYSEGFHFGFWIFGAILFIPANLFVGLGLVFSISEVLGSLFLWDFTSVTLNEMQLLIVCVLFMSFNIFYLIKSYQKIRNLHKVWFLIAPIIISFIEYSGCAQIKIF
ncbi:hypothetical protein [Marinicellulosiphila megalodicopiae]|uniref:hypothetical protein n=1 Tax=Marinicellulosiphila megalodicopiae TaxID=2724896 RepID=UPI003BB11DDD